MMQHLVSSLSTCALTDSDDTRFCISAIQPPHDEHVMLDTIQPPHDEHIMLETCRGL